ncbi:MAG: PGPGW domain-containing protein [Acidimicrobiia bacterium]|nr:PGPGW domain-containing protein [Acidimicrobiia bacterium]
MTIPESPGSQDASDLEKPSGLVRKTGVAVAGGAVTAAGVVMLVTPGPGVLAIAVGLGILGTEFRRPRRLLDRVKDRISGTNT